MRRASESLNVRHEYDQQRRTRCEAWCEERAGQQAPPRACEQGGASSSARSTEEKQRGDVKRAGASARTSEHDRASSYLLIRWGRIAAPLRTLRAPSAHSHMLRGPAFCARFVFLINFLMSEIQENFYLCCVTNNFKSLFVSKFEKNLSVFASNLRSGLLLLASGD